MEAQKDANGFELQNTMAPEERKQSIPTEPPKVPESRNSTQGPPKPSKSNTLPVNGSSNSAVSVENGHNAKSKSEEAEESRIAVNIGYFTSWQAFLKIFKMVCFIAMLVSMSIPISGLSRVPKTPRFDRIWSRMPTMHYSLAVAVLGLLVEIATFVIYFLSLNRLVYKFFSPFPFVLVACHGVMLLFTFVAPIMLNVEEWHGPAITSYIAFDMLALIGNALDIYFNTMWLTGGPELFRLPFF